ncbi:hypothetical protein [Polyangium aurulentum]|uniref:hypothetical protein n=1 Tax=Polyangium aurulentum TaxID=2567896 RepID=UPI0010AEC419|nr:hypothetical protein [Polyangium aurulentum]UQA58809.1 hypothetical protein E8A73_047570 [Polyangium aurulentum]
MTNPYQPPASYDTAAPRAASGVETLVQIATFQRHINLAILAYFGAGVFARSAGQGGLFVLILSGLAALCALAFSLVNTLRLANVLHGSTWAVVCGVLMFVPGLNLVTLFVLSSNATSRLRNAGIKVGLLGASPNDVRAALGRF